MMKSLKAAAAIMSALIVLTACESREEAIERYLESAIEYQTAGDNEVALVEVKNVLNLDPSNGQALFLAASLQEDLEMWQGMHNNLRRLIELEPENAEAMVLLAKVLMLSGSSEEATTLIGNAMELSPDNADAMVINSALLLTAGDAEGAEQAARKAKDLDADNIDAIAALVAILLADSKHAEAHTELDLAEQLSLDPETLYSLRLRVQAGEQNLAAMEQTLEKLIVLAPKTLSYRQSLAAVVLNSSGIEEALKVLKTASTDLPDRIDAKILYAGVLSRTDQEAAADVLRNYVKKLPREPDLQLALAKILEIGGKTEDAMAVYEQLVSSDITTQSTASAKSKLARNALANEDQVAARKIVDSILEKDANNPDALLIRAYLKLSANEIDAAITDARLVLRNEAENDRALELLGRTYLAQRSNALAQESFREALAVNPYNNQAARQLVLMMVRNKKLDEATKILRPIVLSLIHI